MFAAEWGTGQVLWSVVWISLFAIWIWMLFVVFGDIFRSPDLGGWGKALWSLFVLVTPYLGVFVYLIARGRGMQERAYRQQDAMYRQYAHAVNGGSGFGGGFESPAAEVARLADLRSQGVISETEFLQAKSRVLT